MRRRPWPDARLIAKSRATAKKYRHVSNDMGTSRVLRFDGRGENYGRIRPTRMQATRIDTDLRPLWVAASDTPTLHYTILRHRSKYAVLHGLCKVEHGCWRAANIRTHHWPV